MTLYSSKTLSVLLGAGLLIPTVAAAQVGAAVHASAALGDTGASVQASSTTTIKLTAVLERAKGRADKEVDRRITALTDLNARIQNMQRVTADFKTSISTAIQSQITGLTQLKAKIDADADEATLKTDMQSVADSYRVFALVLPQARIAAAADREVTLTTMMNQLGAKLQARLESAQNAGQNVSALMAALTDMSNKLKDASTQAQAAVSVTAGLQPDQGDKTKMASNTSTLKTGRSDLQAGQKDLVAARKDVQTILEGLKKLPAPSATASSTTQVQAQTTTQAQ